MGVQFKQNVGVTILAILFAFIFSFIGAESAGRVLDVILLEVYYNLGLNSSIIAKSYVYIILLEGSVTCIDLGRAYL